MDTFPFPLLNGVDGITDLVIRNETGAFYQNAPETMRTHALARIRLRRAFTTKFFQVVCFLFDVAFGEVHQ